MKKIIMLIFTVSSIGIVLLHGCTQDELLGEDDCNETVMYNGEDRTFNFRGFVKNADDTPYVGPVEVVMFKTYCEGHENGRKTLNLTTNADGAWNSSWNQTYTYKNEYDEVELLIYLGGPEHQFINQYSWYWSDVDTEYPEGFVMFIAQSKIGN